MGVNTHFLANCPEKNDFSAIPVALVEEHKKDLQKALDKYK